MYHLSCLMKSRILAAVLAILFFGTTVPAFGDIVIRIYKRSRAKSIPAEFAESTFDVQGPSTAVVSGRTNQDVRFTSMSLRGEDRTLGTIIMTLDPTHSSTGTLSPLARPRPLGAPSFPMVHTQDFFVVVSASALGSDSLISNTPIKMQGTLPSLTPTNVTYHMVGPPVKFYKRGDGSQATVLTITDLQTDVSEISIVSPSPSISHPGSSLYVPAYRVGDFNDLATKILSDRTPQPVRGPDGPFVIPAFDTTHVESGTQTGVGTTLRLNDWLALDLGLAVGSGTASRTSKIRDQEGVPLVSQKADFRLFGASVTTKVYPLQTERVQPWFSAGVRGLALRPTGGADTSGNQRLDVPSRDFQPASTADFISGVGSDIHLTDWLGVTFSGEHGFRTGWRAGAAVTFALPWSRPSSQEPAALSYTCESTTSKCTCKGAKDCLDMGRAGVCTGTSNCTDDDTCSCHWVGHFFN